MEAIFKARNFANVVSARGRDKQVLSPSLFQPPPGSVGYTGQSYKWTEVLKYRFWVFVACNCWIREIAGGAPINLGKIRPKAKLGGAKSKAIGGPKAHHEFEPFPDDNPFVRTFQKPNHYDVAYDMWAYHTLFYLLTAEAHWWVMRNRWGVPLEIWVIPSHWMRLVSYANGLPAHYVVQSPWGVAQEVPYNEVINFYWHSPLNRYEGYGALLAMSEWIDAYEASVRAQLAQYKNGAIPNFHIQLSDVYGDPDEAFLRRFYGKWFERFQGEDRTNLPLITGSGVEVKPLSISPVEMNYIQNDDSFRDRILAAFGVSKMLSGVEPTQDTSAYAPGRFFARYIINPVLHYFSQKITHEVMKVADEDAIAFWDDRVMDDPEHKQREYESGLSNGYMTINEVRTKIGLEPYPRGGDNPMIGGSPVPWVKEEQQPQQGGGGMEALMGGQGKSLYDDHDAELTRAFNASLKEHDGSMHSYHQAREDNFKRYGVDFDHPPETGKHLHGFKRWAYNNNGKHLVK